MSLILFLALPVTRIILSSAYAIISHSIALTVNSASRSSNRRLQKLGPSTDLCGHPFVTGLLTVSFFPMIYTILSEKLLLDKRYRLPKQSLRFSSCYKFGHHTLSKSPDMSSAIVRTYFLSLIFSTFSRNLVIASTVDLRGRKPYCRSEDNA